MDFTTMSGAAILANTLALAKREREVTLEVLHHFREIERRSIYAERGSPQSI